jgi:hypothetical protein
MGARGRTAVERDFSREAQALEMERLMREMLSKKNAPSTGAK